MRSGDERSGLEAAAFVRGGETRELADIYVRRGLYATLAMTAAQQLMVHNISEMTAARPIQAALASAAAFSAGAVPPLLIALVMPAGFETATVSVAFLAFLVVLAPSAPERAKPAWRRRCFVSCFGGRLQWRSPPALAVFGAHV
jgi:VIT1/CCC1 family predicted Fe2+/Mn2+ transporter